MFGRNRAFSASEPQSSSASIAPCVSSGQRSNARFAECHISSTAVARSCGRPWPPYSGFLVRPFQPLSQNCLYASLKPAGVVTEPSSFQRAPSRSPDLLIGSSTLVANLPASSRIAATTSDVASSNPGSLPTGLEAGELVQDELHVRQGCVIGAHRWTSSNRKGRRSSVAPAARANALIDAAQRAAPVARRRPRATARRARTPGAAAARAVSRARRSAPAPPRTGRRRGRSRRSGRSAPRGPC